MRHAAVGAALGFALSAVLFYPRGTLTDLGIALVFAVLACSRSTSSPISDHQAVTSRPGDGES